jgi:hypothetical protein
MGVVVQNLHLEIDVVPTSHFYGTGRGSCVDFSPGAAAAQVISEVGIERSERPRAARRTPAPRRPGSAVSAKEQADPQFQDRTEDIGQGGLLFRLTKALFRGRALELTPALAKRTAHFGRLNLNPA